MNLNPLRWFTATQLHWFEGEQDDSARLIEWLKATPTYALGQATDATWHRDAYEEVIAHDTTGATFARAADLLLRYQFYPAFVMAHASTFAREGRRMQIGDRIVQRVHVIRPFGIAVIDVLTLNHIVEVTDEARRAGFTYVTTSEHSEEGEWSAHVEWRANNDIVLTVNASSRPSPTEPTLIRPFMRYLQRRAHHAGIDAFKQAVSLQQ